MNRNEMLLLRTLLKSTSGFNLLKYSKDKKKKKQAVGNIVGMTVLYIMVMGYCIAMCVGYGAIGLVNEVPMMCALMISGIAFLFTLFKTNGYLFAFKEYDMLMAMPFEIRSVARAKFLYMYVKSLPWYMSLAVAMLIGFAVFAKPIWYIYPLWIILSLVLPIIPMLFAALIGYVIAKIGTGFKKTKIVQMILTFAFIILCFGSRFIIEAIFQNGKVEETLGEMANVFGKAGNVYRPAKWFSNAMGNHSLLAVVLLILVSAVLLELVFIPVSRSYRQINSALMTSRAKGHYEMSTRKEKSLVNAIAFKEFRRMTGSTVYMTNVAVGEVLATIIGIIALIVGMDRMIAVVTQGAPVSAQMLWPAIPLIIYFFIGMVPSTVCSPSLEGKNYWIIKSLPIETKTYYRGKLLFNMYLTVPFMSFGILCLCISAKAGVINTIMYLVLGIVLCAFSSCFGLLCGLKHIRLEWENEIEVVKQGAAVAIYLFPNMFVTMGLIVGAVALGLVINQVLVVVILICVAALFTALCYWRAMRIKLA